MHDMQKQSVTGLGSWQQCKDCGATKDSGVWWLGGYKSKHEPPCEIFPINEDWRKSAKLIDMNDSKAF